MISRKVQNREIFHLNFIDVLVALGGVLSLPLLKLFLIKLVYDLQRGQAREGTVFVVVSRVFLALRNVMRTHKLAEQSVTPLNSWQAPDCVGHKLLFNLRYQEVGQPAAAKFKVHHFSYLLLFYFFFFSGKSGRGQGQSHRLNKQTQRFQNDICIKTLETT